MEREQNYRDQRKKTATIAMLLAVLLFLTGTFAWISFSQRALNEVELTRNSGGRIHDDYYAQGIINSRSNSANKNVYAENFGENNLYVRIKLSEYLEIEEEAITGEDREDKTTWEPYTIGNDEDARDYVAWELGGEKIFLPTFNIDQDDTKTDAKGDAIDVEAGTATGIGDGSHDYFIEGETYTDEENYPEAERVAKPTITQEEEVMSMEEWQEAEQPVGDFWVIDGDGWAYWANALVPGEATSLLLGELNMTSALLDSNMYYAIDVIGEFATGNDIDKFYDETSEYGDASEEAQELLAIIAGRETVGDTIEASAFVTTKEQIIVENT